MVKKIILFAFFVCIYTASKAQVYLDNMYKQANEMATATLKGDFVSLLKYTHPTVIKTMGGEQKATATIKEGTQKLKETGVKFKKVAIGKVTQCIVSKANIQCVVPQIIDIEMMQQIIHSTSYLLGISYDGGKKWYFVDANNSEKLRKMLPEMDKKLVIPQIKLGN